MAKRDKNNIGYVVEFEDGTTGFMSISHWHVRGEDGLLPNKPIVRVRRLLQGE
jgi:hypothetical protein